MSRNPIGSNDSKLSDGDLTKKEQGNEQRKGREVEVNEEDEGEECFYESLERIASSNSCSCSNSTSPSSDSDSDPIARSSNANHPFPVPKFPKVVSQFDIWISEPASVSERRTRLLREMGLSRHSGISRIRPGSETDVGVGREVGGGGGTAGAEFGRRSVSSNPLVNKELEEQDRGGEKEASSSAIVRSNSDDDCNDVSVSSSPLSLRPNSSSLILSVGLGTVNNNNNICECNQSNAAAADLRRCGSNGSKPPTGRISKSLNGELGFKSFGDGEAVVVDDEINCSEQACTIKNLDNGEQFVVNEIREDGMWNKLKEVGTGRQLTMEEFEVCVGHSPIVQELMRRQNVEEGNKDNANLIVNGGSVGVSMLKKKGGWFKSSLKSVANSVKGNKEKRSSDEKDTSSEKGGRRSSSATDDSQDVPFHGPERVRVKQYGKPCKELTALYKSQEIHAHTGSIWSIKFSLDGKYLASAGEDCIIHVWKVIESERKGELLMEKSEDGNLSFLLVANGSPEPTMSSPSSDLHSEKKRRGRSSVSRKSLSLDHIVVPETVFALTDKPICSFQGHLDDVLDLSWSKSQQLLSSSMDKTVRLWDLTSKTCLRIFSHSDYVTCIQFNPVDDRYFISGSLDAKVRIWSIPDCKVVDWNDLHEMVTAACYTPDGQVGNGRLRAPSMGALVGSYKGSCQLYNASENKLLQKSQINLQNKKKKSHLRKITGFQFAPGSSSEVLVTSADSRIRVVDGSDLIHKFKGFGNTDSQISASVTASGKHVVCASEDSYVYVWKHEVESRPSRNKGVTETCSYEHFHCKDVSVAIPWPGIGDSWGLRDAQLIDQNCSDDTVDEVSTANHPPTPVVEYSGNEGSVSASGCTNSPLHETISSASNSYFFDRISATWPEEKLLTSTRTWSSVDFSGVNPNMSAWGMVIVTAGLRGEIRAFQNFGLPFRI